MPMKTKHVMFLTVFILLLKGLCTPIWAQDIPINYTQNPNMEHELSVMFWSGWDDSYFGIYSHPLDYLTTEEAHSGNQCMEIWVMPGGYWGTWVWVSYPVRGHEEKKFKASFWYKGYFRNYWNFIYRDVGMTFEDLHPSLAEFVGADSAYYAGTEQDALQFDFGGEDGYTEDWTYFEFVWDFPGTIPGWGNTAMWWASRDSAYIDDLYYGEWYDGRYSGEEPFGFSNGDFEKSQLGAEWLININPGGTIEAVDFLSEAENKTEAGFQSLRLMDYMEVSEEADTTTEDRNATYYLPAMGAEGKDMEMSFWYKGNEASLDLFFYDDYQITTDVLPVPEGAQLLALETITDTTDFKVDSTIIYDYSTVINSDTAYVLTILAPETVGSESFDNVSGTPALMDWNWSGTNYFGYNDWAGQIKGEASYSFPKSLWLPGDPNWTGTEGTLPGIVDHGTYSLSFMYKGKLQLVMKFGNSLKYDLANDPDGIVPPEATVSGKELVWDLSSDEWNDFSFVWEVGTWLADSSIASPTGLVFDLVGTYTTGDVGYVDNLEFAEVVVPVDVLAKQDFDGLNGAKPQPLDWNWSDAGFFGWNDWDGEMVENASFSAPTSLWVPSDPGWTGTEGIIQGITDSAAYSISFMYKGNLKLSLDIGADLKYNLAGDPEGIVPPEASVEGRSIVWELSAENGWKKFSYAWEQGSWLADSSVTAPANMTFLLWDSEKGDGFVDDLLILKSKEKLGAASLVESDTIINDVYAIEKILYDTTYTIESTSNQVIVDGDSDLKPLAMHWALPDAADWTQWKLNWTNPSGDIGSTLTLILDSKPTASPDYITPDKKTFTDDHAGWTYFDDFVYEIATGINDKSITEKEIKLYPNPAVDVLYLSIQDPLASLTVHNSYGQLVKSINNPDRKFDVSDLPSGIYMLKVTDQSGNIYKSKFIKK
jgi:hypothetical protein